ADAKALRLVDSAIFRKIDVEETCLLDTATKAFFSVNPTGLTILEELSRGRTRAQILSTVCEQFDVETAHCRDDVDTFLDELETSGLIRTD
ncbi:MAG: PqqD family protein, partial [Myxococcota bacterium]